MIKKILNYVKLLFDKINSYIVATKFRRVIVLLILCNITIFTSYTLLYFAIPKMLNYAPGIINTQFEVSFVKAPYIVQIIVVCIVTAAIITFTILSLLREIKIWDKLSKDPVTEKRKNDIINQKERIRLKCFNLPYKLYLFECITYILIVIIMRLGFGINSTASLGVLLAGLFKVIILVSPFMALIMVISFTISKRLISEILYEVFDNTKKIGKRHSLKQTVIIQIVPLFIAAIFLMGLYGYSKVIDEKGDLLFNTYKTQLNNSFNGVRINNSNDALNILKNIDLYNINNVKFVVNASGKIDTENNKSIDRFFIRYMNEIAPQYNDRIYGFYGSDIQGVFKTINTNVGDMKVGIQYDLASYSMIGYLFILSVVTIVIFIVFLRIFSRSITENINDVTSGLKKITARNNAILGQELPIISNDEISNLIVAFNKIQELERKHREEIELNQRRMVEREKFAGIGEFTSGFTHSAVTMISTLISNAEFIRCRISQYEKYINDIKDETELAKVSKIHKYMVDASEAQYNVSTGLQMFLQKVNQQIKDLGSGEEKFNSSSFSLNDVIEDINFYKNVFLKEQGFSLELENEVEDTNIRFKGIVTPFSRVIYDMFSNSVYEYKVTNKPKGAPIILKITSKDNNVVFSVIDTGRGLSSSVSNRIFKQSYSTKGKDGSGIGLYMAHNTIYGRFGGDIEIDKDYTGGAKFNIILPVLKH